MSQYLDHFELFSNPIFLSDQEQKIPITVLQNFFSDYNLSELREFLDEMQETCLTTDNPPFDEPEKRADLILLIKNLTRLSEAAFLMQADTKENEPVQ